MDKNNKMLFDEFKAISKHDWIDKANIDLKGADFEKKLVWKNMNHNSIQPFYNTDDKIEALSNTGENASSIVNYRKIIVKTGSNSNSSALKAVEEGMTGLLFDLKTNISPYDLLDGIDLNEIAVSFILRKDETKFARDFFAFVNEKGICFRKLKGYFDLDIIYDYVTTGNFDCSLLDIVTELVTLSENYPNYKAISVSGAIYLDSGSNQVQEITYTLSSLVFLIEKYENREVPVQYIFDNLHIELSIGTEFFLEIGKFRAFNSLLHQIAKKYGVLDFAYNLTAKTSIWNKSITDAHTNMLRATTETMSAILGNVHGVEVDPYDDEFNDQSDFSSRIAGNIATILKEESYFGKVSNPTDGSYYIEEVTNNIANSSLELFKILEANGGYYRCFESERIQKQIAEIRFEKLKLISRRRLVMVGVNKYPNLMEKVDVKLLSDKKLSAKKINKILSPRRATLEIEYLRRNTEVFVNKTNSRPVVELCSYGNIAMRKARAAFSYDFIGISAYKVLDEQSYCCAEKAAEESAKSSNEVVVICSSDKDYAETAVDFVKTFRSINTDKVLLLAGNPSDIADELINAGLDGFINIKTDVIDSISMIQNKIEELVIG